MHRARAYKGSKLGPEKQARQNPKVGSGTGPAVRPYRNRSKCNTGGKCSICSDSVSVILLLYLITLVLCFVLNIRTIYCPVPIN